MYLEQFFFQNDNRLLGTASYTQDSGLGASNAIVFFKLSQIP